MARAVLEQEVGVQNLSVSEHSKHFMPLATLVDELVTCEPVHARHVPPHEYEQESARPRFSKLVFKDGGVGRVAQGVATGYDTKAPDPRQEVVQHEDVEGSEEPLISFETHFAFGVEVSLWPTSTLPTQRQVDSVSHPDRH